MIAEKTNKHSTPYTTLHSMEKKIRTEAVFVAITDARGKRRNVFLYVRFSVKI